MSKKTKKSSPVTSKTGFSNKYPNITLVLFLVVGLTLTIFYFHNKNEKVQDQGLQKIVDRHLEILNKITEEKIHPLLKPVHIYIGENFSGNGTLVLNGDGGSEHVITAAHLFSETHPGSDYYNYRVLLPGGYGEKGDFSAVNLDFLKQGDGIEDVARCFIGKPSLIFRTSKVKVSGSKSMQVNAGLAKMNPFWVTSLVTGEKFQIVGAFVTDEKVPFYVMLYDAVKGESGTGFWDGKSALYIFSATTSVSNQTREILSIPLGYDKISLMSAAGISW